MRGRSGGDGKAALSPASGSRLEGFRIHLLLYGIVVAVLALINLFWLTGGPWFVVFMVAWMAPLAAHCAYAMGLFGGRKN